MLVENQYFQSLYSKSVSKVDEIHIIENFTYECELNGLLCPY